MMKEGTKNALKFILAMFILFWGAELIFAGDATEWRAALLILLLTASPVLLFLLLRKFYAIQISKRQAQALQEYKRQQPMQQDGAAAISSQELNCRLEQLDSFLKSGIIDKKEYAAMKKKYQGRG